MDDDRVALTILCAMLRAAGAEVEAVGSGAEGLDRLRKTRYDFLLCDIYMSGMDGFETLRHLREKARVPVIMLTARASDRDKLRGLEGGADDYVTKPFNPDELAARVAAVLRDGQA